MKLLWKVIVAAALIFIFKSIFGEGFYSGYGCAWAQIVCFTIVEILIDKLEE